MEKTLIILFFLCVILTNLPAKSESTNNWSKKSPLELMNMQVTSVSKAPEDAFSAAAAVYVITRKDIERSGATTIPEVLRLAPGIQVARAGSSKWAISARGFNDQFANKLLVLIDGRSVYTPLFSGVYWDVQDLLIEDIKQIEVIRGPGATLWGANAVNGIINIITEEAVNTQGTLVSGYFGTEELANVSARKGGKLNKDLHYRVFAKYSNRAEMESKSNVAANDNWQIARSGFRLDWNKGLSDFITLQGDTYKGKENQNVRLPSTTVPFAFNTLEDGEEVSGGNIISSWKHSFNNGSNIKLQTYLDYVNRNIVYLEQQRVTYDVDFQHSLASFHRNEITWGAGYRLVSDDLEGTTFLSYSPSQRTDHLFSSFIQDKISIIPNQLYLTVGTKLEHNNYTGFEVQPSARVSFLASENDTLWASVSRAVRVPNRNMDDVRFFQVNTPLGPGLVTGNRSVDSESVITYEFGYRTRILDKALLDFSLFYNDYDDLASFDPVSLTELTAGNSNSGKSHGFEVATKYEVNDQWDLGFNYSFIKINLDIQGASLVTAAGKTPKHQFNISSNYKLPYNFELSNYLYYTGELSQASPGVKIDPYTRFDSNLSWQPNDTFKFSLVGQNLLDHSHPEFSEFIYGTPVEIGRSVYGKVQLKF